MSTFINVLEQVMHVGKIILQSSGNKNPLIIRKKLFCLPSNIPEHSYGIYGKFDQMQMVANPQLLKIYHSKNK